MQTENFVCAIPSNYVACFACLRFFFLCWPFEFSAHFMYWKWNFMTNCVIWWEQSCFFTFFLPFTFLTLSFIISIFYFIKNKKGSEYLPVFIWLYFSLWNVHLKRHSECKIKRFLPELFVVRRNWIFVCVCVLWTMQSYHFRFTLNYDSHIPNNRIWFCGDICLM